MRSSVRKVLRAVGVGVGSAGLIFGNLPTASADMKIKVKCTGWVNVYPDSAANQISICENVTVDTATHRATMGANYYARWNGPGEGKMDIYHRAVDYSPDPGSVYCNPPKYLDEWAYSFRHMKTGVAYRFIGGQAPIVARKHIKGTNRCTNKIYHPLHGRIAVSVLAADPDVYVNHPPKYLNAGPLAFG